MNRNQETEFDITALTAEEREIIRALRDPEKAKQLYVLMQAAEKEAAEVEKNYGTLALSLGLE